MRRNNFLHFNPRQYENHLSPFGRKVLGNLIKHWSADLDRNRSYSLPQLQHRHTYASDSSVHRRVLTFDESNIPNTSTHNINLNEHGVRDRRHFECPATPAKKSVPLPSNAASDLPTPFPRSLTILAPPAHQSSVNPPPILQRPPVHTSAELIKVANEDTNNELRTLSREDLITSSTYRNDDTNERDIFDHIQVEHNADSNTKLDDVITNARNVFDECQNTKDVDWDDMFDTELLSDVDTSINISEIIQKQNDKERFSNDQFPVDKIPEMVSKNIHKKKKDVSDSKNTKRKNQSKVTDTIPKKIKKAKIETDSEGTQLPKISYRKQKYTTTIKNWLNDVDPNNPVEDTPKVIEFDGQATNGKIEIAINKTEPTDKAFKKVVQAKLANKSQATKTGKPEIVINKTEPTDKTFKKVVQAKLANRGGIMKFTQPRNTDENSIEPTKSEAGTSEIKIKDKTKEKKTMPKFVVPIKSQIPIKDITYEVIEVTETKPLELSNIEDQEIIAFLLYSNGFCQLNSQHTEDACVAEGIMLYANEKHFYVEGDKTALAGAMTLMLRNNTLVCYNGKALLIYLLRAFEMDLEVIRLFNIIDVKIAGNLLEPDNPPETFAALQRLTASEPEFTIATTCVKQKAAWYATLLQGTATAVRHRLLQEDLWQVFVDIEMSILPIIADMEQRGVCVDLEKLKEMEKILVTQMKQVENECMAAAGRSFQINSTVQVRAILYDELKLDERVGIKVRETLNTGAKSTSETMLRSLGSVHPLPRLILEYRHLHKAHATFVQGIAQYVRGGVVKPVWVQTAAATGRIASSNPNLQAIPKVPFSLRLFSENDQEEALRFRCVYIARPGHVVLAADWRHVECRVFARAAADTALQTALTAPDLFRRLAADWLHKPEEEVSSSDRERTKRIVYASLYGAGPRKLMDILDVDYSQALSIAASFDRTFPSLRNFGRRVAEQCMRANGRVSTLCGRARTLSHISSADAAKRAQAERQALNFIVQGSAADLCKLAMSGAVTALGERGLRARLLLQIHDELVWEVHQHDLHDAADVIRTAMEQCGSRVGLPALPIALAAGPSWGELETYPTTSTQEISSQELSQLNLINA